MSINAMKQALEALEIASEGGGVNFYEYAKDLRQAIAEAEKQEPVTTLDDLEQEIYENTRQFVSRDVMEWMLKRYYTSPPQRQWVGLTDEDEIDWDGTGNLKQLVEAVEAKLKEKNT